MKLEKVDVLLLKTLIFLEAGILVFQVLGKDSWTSALFYMTFPATVLLWLRTVRKTLNSMDLLILIVIFIATINVLVDAGLNNADLDFSYLRKLIMFSITLLFLQVCYRIKINQNLVVFIGRVIDGLTLFLIAMFFLRTSAMFTLNGRVTSYLTFKIGNPNLSGLFLTCLFMLELYRIFTRESWWRKIYHIGLSIFLLAFILLTQSRNCLIAVTLYTIITIWLILRRKSNLRIKKSAAIFCAIFPVLFLVVYMLYINSPVIQKVFSFMISEGKSLDSRMKVWIPAVQHMSRSPLIGAYCGFSNGLGISQAHNTHLDIAVSYGVPVLVLVCIALYHYIYQAGRIYESKQEYTYILGFICAIILGIGEAALFSGGLGLYVFVGAFLMLSRRNVESESVRVL